MAELEHRLCDKIDEVARVLTNTLAEKFETSRRFRLVENRLQCLLEIVIMIATPESEPKTKKVFAGLVKGSKKLKNPSVLLLHIKT